MSGFPTERSDDSARSCVCGIVMCVNIVRKIETKRLVSKAPDDEAVRGRISDPLMKMDFVGNNTVIKGFVKVHYCVRTCSNAGTLVPFLLYPWILTDLDI